MIRIPLPTWLLTLATSVFIACIYVHGNEGNLVNLIISSIGFFLCLPDMICRIIEFCKSLRGKK